jgi:hypothetical protein
MRRYEFETHRWSRVRDDAPDECMLECVVASVRNGWTVLGYEVRLYCRNHLMYRSRVHLMRKLANDEADSLLREALTSLDRGSSPTTQAVQHATM